MLTFASELGWEPQDTEYNKSNETNKRLLKTSIKFKFLQKCSSSVSLDNFINILAALYVYTKFYHVKFDDSQLLCKIHFHPF